MACMEHVCCSCNEVWMDNSARGICPKCKSADVMNFFDEPREYEEPEEEE